MAWEREGDALDLKDFCFRSFIIPAKKATLVIYTITLDTYILQLLSNLKVLHFLEEIEWNLILLIPCNPWVFQGLLTCVSHTGLDVTQLHKQVLGQATHLPFFEATLKAEGFQID